jgi:hypothetical protein
MIYIGNTEDLTKLNTKRQDEKSRRIVDNKFVEVGCPVQRSPQLATPFKYIYYT